MKKTIQANGLWLLTAFLMAVPGRSLLAQGGQFIGWSSEMKWLRVNALHGYYSEQGAEAETGGDNEYNNRFSWPAEYGLVHSTVRSNGMMLGCRDYYDIKVDRTFPVMVTNIGPKPSEYPQRPIPNAFEFKLVGRFDHPIVSVDGNLATQNTLYDVLDDMDPTMAADRMLVVRNHTPIGVTVTKKVYAFTQQYNDNYYILDYVLKNTGIVDAAGTENPQTIKDFYFYLTYRYALAGESLEGTDQTWGASGSGHGRNVECDVVGTDPTASEFTDPNSPSYKVRGHFAFYGPHSGRSVSLEDDWGCPNEKDDGILAAAKYVGHMTIYADKSSSEHMDDPAQPRTTHYLNTEVDFLGRANSQYNENYMVKRYDAMRMGHAVRTQAEEVELSGLGADLYGSGNGGTTIVQGFGPYTLETGDSVHLVLAGGVAGLSRAKNREVGANWLQYYKGSGAPVLVMPNGLTTTDRAAYKKAWVLTCKDSILQMYRRAIQNYESGYVIPQPPPPPKTFTVNSGGDRIQLSWADNATTDPHFGGYVIYRSEGNVMVPKTVYTKVFECGKADAVHKYDDLTPVRGFNYYYYIQSKDDGTQNTVEPGVPLVSGMFWTATNVPATLQRPAGTALQLVRVVPNPYDIRARSFQFGDDFQYDRIAFYGLPPTCKVRVFTERGDVVWEKNHTNGAGDELWDSLTSSGQIVVSGVYILYVEVDKDTYAQQDVFAGQDYGDVRKGDLVFHTGDLMFKAGDSVFRKFVVIR